MTFFHIPLIESYESPIDIGSNSKPLLIGQRLEGSGASKSKLGMSLRSNGSQLTIDPLFPFLANSGFFEQAILSQGELIGSPVDGAPSPPMMDEFWEGESEQTHGRSETKVIVNGHCHISDDCRRVQGVWMCFGGGAAYSGYGKDGFERRMRVYQISDFGETIESYKLLDSLQIIDRMVLVGEGARV